MKLWFLPMVLVVLVGLSGCASMPRSSQMSSSLKIAEELRNFCIAHEINDENTKKAEILIKDAQSLEEKYQSSFLAIKSDQRSSWDKSQLAIAMLTQSVASYNNKITKSTHGSSQATLVQDQKTLALYEKMLAELKGARSRVGGENE